MLCKQLHVCVIFLQVSWLIKAGVKVALSKIQKSIKKEKKIIVAYILFRNASIRLSSLGNTIIESKSGLHVYLETLNLRPVSMV